MLKSGSKLQGRWPFGFFPFYIPVLLWLRVIPWVYLVLYVLSLSFCCHGYKYFLKILFLLVFGLWFLFCVYFKWMRNEHKNIEIFCCYDLVNLFVDGRSFHTKLSVNIYLKRLIITINKNKYFQNIFVLVQWKWKT